MIYSYDREKLNRLFSGAHSRTFDKGEILTETTQQKSVWMVEEGYIKRYQIANNGGISVQSIYGPREIFSLTYIYKLIFDRKIYDGPETYFYETLTDSKLRSLSGDEFKLLVEANPEVYKDLFALAGERLLSNIEQLENVSLANAHNRVAHLLVFLARKWGRPKSHNRSTSHITVPITQQDIADVLSLTRETVSLAINKLKKDGLLENNRGTLVVVDTKKLQAEAFGGNS